MRRLKENYPVLYVVCAARDAVKATQRADKDGGMRERGREERPPLRKTGGQGTLGTIPAQPLIES